MSRHGAGRSLLVGATILVVATLAAALLVMESPSKQRDRRVDERRIEQLDAIAGAIDAWTANRKRLPGSLAELSSQPGFSIAVVDPVEGTPYGYQVVSGRAYRLCARFATSTADQEAGDGPTSRHGTKWMHPAGRHCFDRRSGGSAEAAAVVAP